MATKFVDGSGQNEQSLERTFHRCFLPSSTSFGWAVSEEKIKMWKVNGQQMPDTKWWQKLTLPLARWAKKKGKIFANLWFWVKCAERDISVTGTHFLVFQMNQTMEHPYRTAINHVIEYDDLSSSQDLPDTFGNDVNRYIFLYKYTSHLDAIIYFMWLSYFLLQILQSLILAVFTSWFSKGYLNNC